MMYRFRLFTVALLVLISSTCLASSPEDRSEQEYKKGLNRVEAKDYEGAIAIFEDLFRRYRTPKALFSMGLCKRLIGRYLASKADFEKFLILPNIDTGLKRRAEIFIAKIQGVLSHLTISGAPNGATVKLDGASLGITPLDKKVFLEPGQHNVELSIKGYETLSKTVSANGGRAIVVVAKFVSSPIIVKINCDIKTGVVWIEGKRIGSCPYEGKLKPGSHNVEVRIPDKEPFTQTIDVEPGDTIVLRPSWPDEIASDSSDSKPNKIPPATSDKNDAAKKDKYRGLLVTGISGLILGIGATGVGVGSIIYGQRTYEKAEGLADQHDGSWDDDAVKRYQSKIDSAKKGVIIGYGIGGAFLITGSVLLFLRSRKMSFKDKETAPVSLTANGIKVRF